MIYCKFIVFVADSVRENFINGVEDELDEGSDIVILCGDGCEFSSLRVVVVVAPENFDQSLRV
jgi:hypothetical protein